MNSLGSSLKVLNDFGDPTVLFEDENKKVLSVVLSEHLAGVKEFRLAFVRDRKRRLSSYFLTRRKRVVVEDSRVEVSTLVSQTDFTDNDRLVSSALKTVGDQLKGHNSEMMAVQLFYSVSRIDGLVKPPKIVEGLLKKPYDIQVPVRSSRANGVVLVPIQVKSGEFGQRRHLERYPKIPSVIMSIEAIETKVSDAQRLLHEYTNHGVIHHI